MIGKFKDFDKNNSIKKERIAMERELIARKNIRHFDEGDLENNTSIADIVELVTFEIIHGANYYISISNKDSLYLQYESDNIGRLKVYKPDDISTIGVIDLNGIIYEEDVDLVRKLYLILRNHLKTYGK